MISCGKVQTNKEGKVDLFYVYLKCRECGSKFTKAGKYYYCNNYARTCSCTKHSTNRENLIKYIERELKAKHIKYDELNRQVLFEYIKDIAISENSVVKINYKSRK